MKLVVGLGNPGKEYEKTRHNIGFYMLDKYLGSNDAWKDKFNGLYKERVINGEKVIFLKPQSYMNLLPVGTYRLKPSGSSGGHNGLKDIELNLGTKNYKRLKIGISNNKLIDTKDYVLGKFSKEELDIYQSLSSIVVNIINDYFTLEFSVLMNKYNHKNK